MCVRVWGTEYMLYICHIQINLILQKEKQMIKQEAALAGSLRILDIILVRKLDDIILDS